MNGTPFIHRAVVLAAGKGTRMGAITHEIPKPLLPVQGKPMLEHILERLAAAGVDRFLIVVGFHHELIERHFRSWPLPIEFRIQETVDGTGSAARLAKDFASAEPLLLTYADILCDPVEYTRASTILRENPNAAGVLAVKDVDDPWQGAAVYEQNGRIREIIEKPPKGTSTTRWNSAGFYAFRPVLFDYLDRVQPSSRGEYELTSALDLMLEDGVELRISPIAGDWRDVGRPEDLAALNAPFTIRPAASADLPDLAALFDDYRIFYRRPSDRAAAERFVRQRLEQHDTRFFLARDNTTGAALGFVHLIPSLGTLAMRPIWYLEDLFVAPSARRRSLGRALMLHAEQFARDSGAERLTLSTAHDNHAAQALYRSVGYLRDEYFWQFHRALE